MFPLLPALPTLFLLSLYTKRSSFFLSGWLESFPSDFWYCCSHQANVPAVGLMCRVVLQIEGENGNKTAANLERILEDYKAIRQENAALAAKVRDGWAAPPDSWSSSSGGPKEEQEVPASSPPALDSKLLQLPHSYLWPWCSLVLIQSPFKIRAVKRPSSDTSQEQLPFFSSRFYFNDRFCEIHFECGSHQREYCCIYGTCFNKDAFRTWGVSVVMITDTCSTTSPEINYSWPNNFRGYIHSVCKRHVWKILILHLIGNINPGCGYKLHNFTRNPVAVVAFGPNEPSAFCHYVAHGRQFICTDNPA